MFLQIRKDFSVWQVFRQVPNLRASVATQTNGASDSTAKRAAVYISRSHESYRSGWSASFWRKNVEEHSPDAKNVRYTIRKKSERTYAKNAAVDTTYQVQMHEDYIGQRLLNIRQGLHNMLF